MELADVLRRRRMVRSYDPVRPVPAAALDAITAAALRAPSAGFTQGVSLLVLEEPAARNRFWALTADDAAPDDRWLRGMQTAPVVVLVWTSEAAYLDRYALPDKGSTERNRASWTAPFWYVDAGMASMAMLLQAVDRELGACFFGVPVDRVDAVRAAFGVPDDQLSVGAVSLGYPESGGAAGSPVRRARRRPEELIHRGRWT